MVSSHGDDVRLNVLRCRADILLRSWSAVSHANGCPQMSGWHNHYCVYVQQSWWWMGSNIGWHITVFMFSCRWMSSDVGHTVLRCRAYCPQMSGIPSSDVGHNVLRCRANILLCSCSAVMLMMSSNVGLTFDITVLMLIHHGDDVLRCLADILLCSWSAVIMWGLTSSDVGLTYYCVHVQLSCWWCPQMSGWHIAVFMFSSHADDVLRCRADILLCSCSTVRMMFSDVRLTCNCVHVQHAVIVTMWCLMSSDDRMTYQRQAIRGCTSAGIYVPCTDSRHAQWELP